MHKDEPLIEEKQLQHVTDIAVDRYIYIYFHRK